MQANLLIVIGDEHARKFELRLPAVIGRSRSTDVRLGHPLVSRHHCELFEVSGKLMLRDLGSLNGTFVGDTRLSDQPMPIASGERFRVGTVTLEAEYQASASHGQAPAWTEDGPTVASPPPQDPDAPRPPHHG